MKLPSTRLACVLASTAVLVCACATLPAVETVAVASGAASTPSVSNARGKLTPQAAHALMAKRWSGTGLELERRAALEEAVTGEPLIAGNKVALLFDGPQTFQAMAEALAGARDNINLETYIFDQDALGQRFADLLIDKQKQGVDVCVMVDAVGTLGTPQAFFDRMRAAGIRVLVFNPVDPTARKGPWRLNNRDHRKVLIVDGKIAFTGGVNISEDYANSSPFRSRHKAAQGAPIGWRDTHVRIEGPAVAALQWLFIDTWVRQNGDELPPRKFFPPPATAGDKLVRVLAGKPGSGFQVYKAFVVAIREARKSIHLTSAYFVPDQQVIDALGQAAERGVDVRLIVPGKSDVGMVQAAGRGAYGMLLERGVKIHELQLAVLHAKTAVIDGSWSTVGSTNIDSRSFLYNDELNLAVIDPEFGRAMESAFQEDLRNSVEVTPEQWRHRPWKERLEEWAARLFQRWL